jgi:hypothetical protein
VSPSKNILSVAVAGVSEKSKHFFERVNRTEI